jgi:glycine cleavage system pyridoxal-binding protein P
LEKTSWIWPQGFLQALVLLLAAVRDAFAQGVVLHAAADPLALQLLVAPCPGAGPMADHGCCQQGQDGSRTQGIGQPSWAISAVAMMLAMDRAMPERVATSSADGRGVHGQERLRTGNSLTAVFG